MDGGSLEDEESFNGEASITSEMVDLSNPIHALSINQDINVHLPESLYSHCGVQIEPSRSMLIGGVRSSSQIISSKVSMDLFMGNNDWMD